MSRILRIPFHLFAKIKKYNHDFVVNICEYVVTHTVIDSERIKIINSLLKEECKQNILGQHFVYVRTQERHY